MYINKNATFAYFTASVNGNDSAKSVIVKTAQIGTITFADGAEIDLKDALPGASKEKTFTITSNTDSTAGVKYGIKFVVEENTFVTKTDLVYSMHGTTSGATSGSGAIISDATENAIEVADGSIDLGSGTLMPGETHSYQFLVRFKETGTSQNDNQGKTFKGHLEVTTGDENGSSMYYNASHSTGTTEEPSSESHTDFTE